MRVIKADWIATAVKPAQYPKSALPEIAFAGRSNVGKSSLINRLTGRKNLVKTSSTPGKTQTINFFNVNSKVVFVDLPGYGYARVPQKLRADWGKMVGEYIESRKQLRAVVHIMDIRRKPMELDFELMDWLDSAGVQRIPVLTKTDKLSSNESARASAEYKRAGLAGPEEVLLTFSSVTGNGKKELWHTIESLTRA